MHSLQGNRTQLRPGFPIRTPSDQRLVGSSPRHFAASHVLHRPPDAKASTVCPYNTTHKTTKQNQLFWNKSTEKSRCSRPLSSSHTTPTTTTRHQPRWPAALAATEKPASHTQCDGRRCLPRHPTAHRCILFILKTATCGQQASTQKMRPATSSTGTYDDKPTSIIKAP